MRVLEWWVLALSLLGCAGPGLAQEAGIEHFTPQGQAKAVRQVTARFATPMTAFGGIQGKLAYEALETKRFIAKHGLSQYQVNPHFPINNLRIMRGLVAARRMGVERD